MADFISKKSKSKKHHNLNHAAVQIAAKMIKGPTEILTEYGFCFQNKHEDKNVEHIDKHCSSAYYLSRYSVR